MSAVRTAAAFNQEMNDQYVAMDYDVASRTTSQDPFDMLLMDELENPPWMFGTDELTWAMPKRALDVPTEPPPGPEEFDRVVRETMVDNLTERVHLQKRVDVVHHGGKPEAGESCNVVMRAMWAMPLVFFAQGVKLASRPLVGCCSAGRAAPEKLQAGPEPELAAAPNSAEVDAAPGSDAPAPEAVRATDAAEAAAQEAEAPSAEAEAAAQAEFLEAGAAIAAELAADSAEGQGGGEQIAPKAKAKRSRPPGANASVLSVSHNVQSSAGALLGSYAGAGKRRQREDGDGGGRGELASVIGGGAPAASSTSAAPTAPASSSSAAPAASAAEAKRRSRPANANASVLSVSQNVSSSAGALLGQYAVGGGKRAGSSGKPRGEAASVIGGPAGGSSSSAPARSGDGVVAKPRPAPEASENRAGDGVMAKPRPAPEASENRAAPAAPSTAASTAGGGSSSSSSKAPENRARPASRSANRQPGESKTVVTNVAPSGSAASKMLGPMLAKQGKKRASDVASAIG